MVVPFLTFWGNSILFSIMAKPIYIPTNKCTRVPSPPYPHQHLLLLVFFGWRRLLRVPWTVRRSNQSILKEINSEYSLEGLMLGLTFQYFGHLMQRNDSLEKTLMLGKMEDRRRRGWRRMRWLDGITDLMDMSLSKLGNWWWTGKPGVLQSMKSQRVGHEWVTELTDWPVTVWQIVISTLYKYELI